MSKSLAERFGDRVRELRRQKGISQEGLADLAGLHRTYMGGIERGERNPALNNIGRIADALGVSLAELFTFPEPKPDTSPLKR